MGRIGCLFLLVLTLLGNGPVQSQQSPQVPIKQETKNPIEGKSETNKPAGSPTNSPLIQEINHSANLEKQSSHSENSGPEEGTEFAVLRGVKFKITDGLLALFTLLLVGATALLAGIAIWQGIQLKRTVDVTRDSVNLAREEFLSTHRPKLRVRRVAVVRGSDGNDKVSIRCDIVNVGATPAKNLAGIYKVVSRPPAFNILPPFPDIPTLLEDCNIRFPTIEAGQTIHMSVEVDPSIQKELKKVRFPDSSNWYFYGAIKYEDGKGTWRETAFCHMLKDTSFYRIDNPGYEYED